MNTLHHRKSLSYCVAKVREGISFGLVVQHRLTAAQARKMAADLNRLAAGTGHWYVAGLTVDYYQRG